MKSVVDADWRNPQFAWPAPAKINLFLHITGRRTDGYHLLQTVFQFIDFCDYLYFSTNLSGEITRDSELAGVPADSDLVVRAARLLRQHCPGPEGVAIRVDKRLPMGGGIGGGSSDAATTLIALNKLWGCGLDVDQLASLGLALGADVPVFVRGHAAWAEGVGEQLTPVSPAEPWYVLIIPPVSINTGEIFSDRELTRDKEILRIRDFPGALTENVCQPVVEQRYPEVARVIHWLAQHGKARMTGTGACVFAPFESESEARAVAGQVPQGWRVVVAKGMNTTHLYGV